MVAVAATVPAAATPALKGIKWLLCELLKLVLLAHKFKGCSAHAAAALSALRKCALQLELNEEFDELQCSAADDAAARSVELLKLAFASVESEELFSVIEELLDSLGRLAGMSMVCVSLPKIKRKRFFCGVLAIAEGAAVSAAVCTKVAAAITLFVGAFAAASVPDLFRCLR